MSIFYSEHKEASDFISQKLIDELENLEFQCAYDIINNSIVISYQGEKYREYLNKMEKRYLNIYLDSTLFSELDLIVINFIKNIKNSIRDKK